ncbi:hypothetical protein QTP88_013452 [Uroleucon formosanum]
MESHINFHQMNIDDRILKAIANQGWTEPTLVQERGIPLLLEGKDMLVRARTGSGKTAAFVIPVIQKILEFKDINADTYCTQALILAPSKELCNQIFKNILQLTIKCSRDVKCVDISGQIDMKEQQPLLNIPPDVIVATPARALLHLQGKNMTLKKLQTLVVDEADLVFSFGFEEEIKEVIKFLPKTYQAVLASATLSEDVLALKKLLLRNAITLKLQEPDLAPLSQLTHYKLNAEEEDKAVILYCCFKLKLVKGKTIVFVNSVDKCYKLKLFLEQFGIHTCVLNSELPASCRCHTINQFNDNIYDIILASDEKFLDEEHEITSTKPSKRKHDKEFSIARGIDFQFVSIVINFDFPQDIYSYIHRVGRTARGKNKGTAISFLNIREQNLLKDVEDYIKKGISEQNDIFQDFNFKLEEVEGFRYRAKDAWRAVTKIAVREARLKEIKFEMLNSKKLKRYFQENPRDLLSLRHDKALHTVKLQDHMSDVPDYMVPTSLKEYLKTQEEEDKGIKKKDKAYYKKKQVGYKKYHAKKTNPLVGMEYTGLKKTPSKDSAYCFYCRAFPSNKLDITFISESFRQWSNACFKSFPKHEQSVPHKESSTKIAGYNEAKQSGSIINKVNTQYNQEVAENREYLKDNDIIRHYFTEKEKNFRYVSGEYLNEFLGYMANIVIRDIVDNVLIANIFSIIVDETQDLSKHEQVAIILRYVNNDFYSIEAFLGFYKVESTDGLTLSLLIKNVLISNGLQLECLRGQCYDGAASLRGAYKGVQSRIKEENPLALYVHCNAHILNLCLLDLSKQISHVRNVFGTLSTLHNFINASSKRQAVFDNMRSKLNMKMGDGSSTLESLSDTRWSCRIDALEFLIFNYQVVIDSENISENDSIHGSDANPLLKSMKTFEFLFCVNFFRDIMSIINILSKYLQSSNIDYSSVQHMTKATIQELSNM